jgi:hypothetical protein
MFLVPEGRIVRVFHKDQTFSSRTPLIWHDRPYRRSKPGDTVCSSGILHNGTDFHLAGTDTVAGIPVVKWSRNYAKLKEDIYLAPSLDCRALKGVQLHLNDWHLPVFRNWMEATAVKLGEPDPRGSWFLEAIGRSRTQACRDSSASSRNTGLALRWRSKPANAERSKQDGESRHQEQPSPGFRDIRHADARWKFEKTGIIIRKDLPAAAERIVIVKVVEDTNESGLRRTGQGIGTDGE